jgi:hypothetical protein
LAGTTEIVFRFNFQIAERILAERIYVRILAARCARGVREVVPRKKRGSRESRVPGAPAARVHW